MSKLQISHGGSKLDINLILGSWRYVKIIVNDDLTIDMRVPIGMKQEMIDSYLNSHADKIAMEYERKKNRNHQALPTILELEEGKLVYRNGLFLPYLGDMNLQLRRALQAFVM